MNFFEHQDQAQSQTKRLIALLALAIIALIIVTTLFVAIALHYTQAAAIPSTELGYFWQNFFDLLDWQLVATVAATVMSVVFIGSLYRISQLQQGGAVVAESLNGKLLNTTHCNAAEKRLLNIVEEMAIAAGVPVPPVYLLDEDGINAFAAGYMPKDAIIGVTRGCIEQLNRDQLQGVIAHEYSHILHGDMRLNLRLVGILYGILLIGLIGQMLLRSGRMSRKNGGGIALLGLGLMVIGYAGTLCGNLIKAGVSRQREFLADASAVQFTRNPTGISDALKHIGGFSKGSSLQAPNAEEYSHFYFANGVHSWMNAWLATHPPLEQRIRRIEPNWNGKFITTQTKSADELKPQADAISGFSSPEKSPTRNLTPENLSEAIGNPSAALIAEAGQLLNAIDPMIRDACHNPASAMAIIYGLLFTDTVKAEQLAQIEQQAPKPIVKLYQYYVAAVSASPLEHRLPIIELCLPALGALSEQQRDQFRQNVIALIKADRQLSLAEWCVYKMLQHNLFPAKKTRATTCSLDQCPMEIKSLLALMAQQSTGNQQQHAYEIALKSLAMPAETLPTEPTAFPILDQQLLRLNRLRPLQKPQLLKALLLTIHADGYVGLAEYELLRVIADSLDCPMPLLN